MIFPQKIIHAMKSSLVYHTNISRTNVSPFSMIGIPLVHELERFVQIFQKLGILFEQLDKENVARLGHWIQCYVMNQSVVAD